VVTGLANIRAGLELVTGFLGAPPTIVTFTPTDRLVMITFTAVVGGPCQIPDGSDTYVVEKGHIVAQTVHDTFAHAPGQICPLIPPPPPGT
jgi:hypothetical protein